MQPGRARLQRPQHDAVAGQDQAAQKPPIGIQRIHRYGRAHHHHNQRARAAALHDALARANHGHPAIGPQAQRLVVAVGHARLLAAGHHPLGSKVPAQHLVDLLMHPPPGGFAGHRATEHAAGRRQTAPGAVGQLFDLL